VPSSALNALLRRRLYRNLLSSMPPSQTGTVDSTQMTAPVRTIVKGLSGMDVADAFGTGKETKPWQ